MSSWLRNLPIFIIIVDLWFNVILNVGQSLDKHPISSSTQNSLAVTPEFAFNWLQVLVNGGMAIILTWALFMLVKAHTSSKDINFKWSTSKICAILICLAFSIPSIYGLTMQIIQAITMQKFYISFQNIRYLMIALLLPFPSILVIKTIINSIQLSKKTTKIPTDAP